MCSALLSPYSLKNDECYTCNTLVSPHGHKNDVHFMCSAFVSPNGLKNNECHICTALVSRHGFKNYKFYICSALVSSHGWKIFSVSRENWPPGGGGPIDSFQDELSPSDPIKSVCQDLQPPSLLLTSYSRYHWWSASRHFRFQSKSDSIRLLVKTTWLRPGVLDMYDSLHQE